MSIQDFAEVCVRCLGIGEMRKRREDGISISYMCVMSALELAWSVTPPDIHVIREARF